MVLGLHTLTTGSGSAVTRLALKIATTGLVVNCLLHIATLTGYDWERENDGKVF